MKLKSMQWGWAAGLLLGLLGAMPGAAIAAEAGEHDDATARHEAMYEWYSDDYSQHGRRDFGRSHKPQFFTPQYQRFLNDAAKRERERYASLMPYSGTSTPVIDALAPIIAAANGNWTNIGPTRANYATNGPTTLNITDTGRVRNIVTDPANGNIIYVGFSGGGVWKTTDGGTTWAAKTETLGSLSVGALEMDPVTATTLYLGLGDPFDGTGIGLVKSTDGGDSWGNVVYLGNSTIIPDIEISRSPNTSIVLAATDKGLYRSTDSGASFSKVTINTGVAGDPYVWTITWGGGTNFVLSLEADLADANADQQTLGQVWRSTDNGATWTQSTGVTYSGGVSRIAVAAAPSNRNIMYAEAANPTGYFAGASDDFANLFKSTDNGVTWTGIGRTTSGQKPGKTYTNSNAESSKLDTLFNGQGWYDQLVLVDPTDANIAYFGGALLLAKTSDGGTSYTQKTNWLAQFSLPYVHADIHAGHIASNGTLYIGSDGGIFRSTDNATTFTDTLNRGIASHLVYQVGSSLNNRDAVIVGLQDNGTRVRETNTSIFNQEVGGDGFGCNINSANANLMLGSLYNDRIQKSTDGGLNFSSACSGIAECNTANAPFITRMADWKGDATGNTLFTYANMKPYKTTNYAGSWTALGTTGLPPTSPAWVIRNIGVAKTSVNTIGVVANGGRAYLTTNGGTGWSQIGNTTNLPGNGLSLSSITFDPTNASIIYIASVAPDSAANHLWRSSNGGSSWSTIDSSASGFPGGVPVNNLIVDPVTPATLYAATHLGVYTSSNSGTTWTRYGAGMPLVNVTDLYVANDASLIRAATFGRSVWEFAPSNNASPVANFTFTTSGLTANFTDTSTDSDGTIASRAWNFGDASTSTATNPSHTYASGGTYTVSLTVTDNGGATNTVSKSVTVTAPTFTIGGSVSGLSGSVTLKLDRTNAPTNTQSKTLSANGSFTFDTALAQGSNWTASVQTQPTGQTCAVTNGSGTNLSANVTNVQVTCTTNTYTLTYTAGANGSISGTTPQTVNHGASGTAVTAVANTGYHFVQWSDGSTANPRTDSNVTANISVTASFAINTYTLTYTAGANGSISGTTPQTVNHGASGTAVTAVANTGYHFVQWSDGSTANPRTDANVTANISVTASFAINTYTLTYTAGTNGSITGTTPQTVNHGASGTAVTAVANTGYHFVQWSDGSTANPRTDTNVTANISVTASFAINTYTVTAAVSGSNGTITPASQSVNHGSTASFTVTPSAGYHVASITGNTCTVSGSGSSYTSSAITQACAVTVTFAINTYTVTAAVSGSNGTITPASQSVNHGSTASFTVTPSAGYHVASISGDTCTVSGSGTSYASSAITQACAVTVTFAINTYTLTYTAGTNGSISGTTPQTVSHGASGTAVTAVANTGYHFVQWSDGSTANPRTDSNVTANISVTASFAINTYTLTYTAGTNGSITGTTPQTVNHGASGTAVTAVANTGYHFVQWSDGSTANPRTDSNVTANISVTASFAINTYTLTYTAGTNGSITGTTPQTVNHGASGTAVTAVANTGYHFVQWSDGSTANPRTDSNVTANISVTASFAINTYTLTYTAGTNGSITGTTPQTVNHGASGTAVTAVANTGYHFVQWSDGSTANPRTDSNVTANISVTASFAINTYTLTYTAGTNGSITGTTPQTVNHGASGTAVTAVANTGYHFVQWSDGSTANPRTDTNVTANISVTASFAINTYTVTAAVSGGNGTITPASQSVNHGSTASFTVTPSAGYHVASITGNTCTVSGSGTSYTSSAITQACAVTVTFAINTYTVTAAVSGSNGTITPASQSVNHGSTASFTVTPSAGYHVASISGDTCTVSGSGTSYASSAITQACAVTVTFAVNTYTVAAAVSGGNGSITPASQSVNHGGTASFVVTPTANYHVASVSGDTCTVTLVSGNNWSSSAITQNCAVTATFAIDTHSVTPSVTGSGTISPNTAQTVNHGATTQFTLAAATGYHLVDVTGSCPVGSLSGGVWTTGAITANCTVIANFAINVYTVTASAGANGAITPASQSVDHGGTASFTVTPNTGYHVASVSGDNCAVTQGSGNTWNSDAITANCAVTATFAINSYTVTAAVSGGNGTITPASQSVNHGGSASFTVTPAANYHVASIDGDNCTVSGSGTSYSSSAITQACAVTVTFAINTYTLTYTAGSNGSISGTTPQTVNHGASGTAVTAVANTGYHFVQWSDGSTANPRTDANVTANISVTASFAIDTFTLTYTAGSNGSIVGTSPQTVDYGASGTAVTAQPATGYHFVKWSDDSTANPRTDANVTANISVTASFAINVYAVTATVSGGNGTITPASQNVNHGGTASFTITPAVGYQLTLPLGGTCAQGTLNGTSYTVSAITAGCSVVASFEANPPDHLVIAPVANVFQGDRLGAVTVSIVDADGNVVTSDSTSQITLATNACGSDTTLEQMTVTNGVATFPANATTRFYTLATGRTLHASSGSLGGNATFNVVTGGELMFADGFESCRL